jgi:hypothetical protein
MALRASSLRKGAATLESYIWGREVRRTQRTEPCGGATTREEVPGLWLPSFFVYGWNTDFFPSFELEGDQFPPVGALAPFPVATGVLCSGVGDEGADVRVAAGAGFFVSSFQCVTKFLYGFVAVRWGSECLLFLLKLVGVVAAPDAVAAGGFGFQLAG